MQLSKLLRLVVLTASFVLQDIILASAENQPIVAWNEVIERELIIIDEALSQTLLELNQTRISWLSAVHDSHAIRRNASKEVLFSLQDMLEQRFFVHNQYFSLPKETPVSNETLRDSLTWSNAGVHIINEISSTSALNAINKIPLMSYIVRGDAKEDTLLSTPSDDVEYRLTRRHVGVLDLIALEQIIPEALTEDFGLDGNVLIAYNLKAIGKLASIVDELFEKINFLSSILQSDAQNSISMRTSVIRQILDGATFKTPEQILSEVAALEANFTIQKLALFSRQFRAASLLRDLEENAATRISMIEHKDASAEKIFQTEHQILADRDIAILEKEADTDASIEGIYMTGEIERIEISLERELDRLRHLLKSEVARARQEIRDEAELERLSETKSLNYIRILGEETVKEAVEIVHTIFQHAAESIQHVMATEEGANQFVFFVASGALLAFALVSAKELTILCFHLLQRLMTTPRLVREYGHLNYWRSRSRTLRNERALNGIMLPGTTKQRVKRLSETISVSRERGSSLRNVLIYGPPGTGKSLLAKEICNAAHDLPYALMSGSDVAPLERRGPSEMRRVLSWASTRQKGSIVIIEDADSALGNRMRGQSFREQGGNSHNNSFSRDSLNVFLSMTGNGHNDFMLILTTSTPDALDAAVIDRMDEIIGLTLPEKPERCAILEREFRKNIYLEMETGPIRRRRKHHIEWFKQRWTKPCKLRVDKCFDVVRAVTELANDESRMSGCSGRELKKIIQGVTSAVYASDSFVLDEYLWQKVTSRLCSEMKTKRNLLVKQNQLF